MTLNQVYNLLDIDASLLNQDTVVFDIAKEMLTSDIIEFHVGTASNEAHN